MKQHQHKNGVVSKVKGAAPGEVGAAPGEVGISDFRWSNRFFNLLFLIEASEHYVRYFLPSVSSALYIYYTRYI